MEIRITKLSNNITEKVQSIQEFRGFPELEARSSDVTISVYAPERGGDFELSFNIYWESEKPKKRRKQLLKMIERYLNVEEIMLIP